MSCGYQGYEFGAGSYPDSLCVDGRLLDADNCDDNGNLYDTGDDIPCPICRPKEAIEYWADQNLDADCDEAKALECATSLVNDIRKNREVAPYIPSTQL
jgi:hypothetical protein